MEASFINVVIGLVLGALAGAASAFIGWNKSGEAFEARKFVTGVITGVIAGIVFVIGIVSSIQSAVDQTALLVIYVTTFIAIIGVDNVRTGITGSVRSNTEVTPSV
jgi:hypothetical protein